MIDYRLIGKRIKEKRQELKISQETLGELADLSPVFISNIENAKKKPSLETLVSISNAYGISMDASFPSIYALRRICHCYIAHSVQASFP